MKEGIKGWTRKSLGEGDRTQTGYLLFYDRKILFCGINSIERSFLLAKLYLSIFYNVFYVGEGVVLYLFHPTLIVLF
jgi:hypothetical protein